MKMGVSITGMRCDSCIEAVTSALKRTAGVVACEVRLGDALITFDEHIVRRAEIFDAIRGAGSFDISGFSITP